MKSFSADSRTALKYLKPAFGLVWQAGPAAVTVLAALTLIGAFLPLGQAYVARWIVDGVVQSIRDHLSGRQGLHVVTPYLLCEFALISLGVIVTQTRSLVTEILNQKLAQLISSRIMLKASKLDLHYFEDAEFYDKMQNARRQSEFRAIAIMNGSFLLVQNAITLLLFGALIIAFSPWIALLLFCATLPAFLAQTHFSRLQFRLQSWKAPESRRMTYYEHLLTVDASAKEVKLFDLAAPLIKRHQLLFESVFAEDRALAIRKSWQSMLFGMIASLSFYLCYAWVILQTIAVQITLGQMTLYLTSFRQLQGTFTGLFENVNRLFENGLFMQNLFDFLELPERALILTEKSLGQTVDKSRGIEFRNVSFRYPKQETWALRNITLTVKLGEKIALVGENGSGKTTLMKLLTGLYTPTEGEIFIYGRPLQSYTAEELHKKISVIFQDFVRYQLSVRENIGFGSIDEENNDARLKNAAHAGGADDLIESLPDGWNTSLGGWFQRGRELSGGQWQKIALSRAFMREGEIVVLDEPTSALDAAKELEIFNRFKEITSGKTAFLISHRFSTVRMADRIIVLTGGAITEMGSHAELMQAAGTYARLFTLQAEGYR